MSETIKEVWRDLILPNTPDMRVRRSDTVNDLLVYREGDIWAEVAYWLTDDGWLSLCEAKDGRRHGMTVGVPIMVY